MDKSKNYFPKNITNILFDYYFIINFLTNNKIMVPKFLQILGCIIFL